MLVANGNDINRETMKETDKKLKEGMWDMGKKAINNHHDFISDVVVSAVSKDRKHSHFWIEDGELYESYNTIRGLRYRHRFSVDGLIDTDKCSESMMVYISKEYID